MTKPRLRIYFDDNAGISRLLMLYFSLVYRAEIIVFDFTRDMRLSRLGRWLLDSGRVQMLYVRPNIPEEGQALDLTYKVAEVLWKSAAYQVALKVYGGESVRQLFRKVLLDDVFRYVYVNRWLERTGAQSILVSRTYIETKELIRKVCPEALAELKELAAPGWLRFFCWFRGLVLRLKVVCHLTAITAAVGAMALYKFIDRRSKKIEFYDHAFCAFQEFVLTSDDRGLASMIKGDRLKDSRSLILVYCPIDSGKRHQVLEQHPFFQIKSIIWPRNWVYWPSGIGLFWNVMQFTVVCIRQPWMASTLLQSLKKLTIAYVIFSVLSHRFVFKNYIYANNEGPRQICFNILARRQGWITWNYMFFLGGGYLRSTSADFTEVRNPIWGFLVYDKLVATNSDLVKFYKMHYQDVKTYHVVGSIFAENIRKITEKECSEAFATIFPCFNRKTVKVIAVFDTTFIDSPLAFHSFDDAVTFYLDMKRYLEDNPNCVMIIKPAKGDNYFTDPRRPSASPRKAAELISVFNSLREHPRVFWAREKLTAAQDQRWNNLAIAISDVVVTHCMSSPTADALAARRRAFWYEHGTVDVGVIFDAIPGLVVHGYSKFVERMKALLYDVTDEQYEQYLEQFIKGRIDEYLDGKALGRFQNLLAESARGDVHKRELSESGTVERV